MKEGIHPDYKKCTVSCACGNSFETRSTVESLHVEICANCHPFYTGKQKLIDSAGRVEQFNRRYNIKKDDKKAKEAEAKAEQANA